jgi:sialidase-1
MDRGQVRLRRRSDHASILVEAGEEAIVAADRSLVARRRSLREGLVGVWEFDGDQSVPFIGNPRWIDGVHGRAVAVDYDTWAELQLPAAAKPTTGTDPGPFALALWARMAPDQVGWGDIATLTEYASLRCEPEHGFLLSFDDRAGQPAPIQGVVEMGYPKGAKSPAGAFVGTWHLFPARKTAVDGWHHLLFQYTAGKRYELHVDGELAACAQTSGQIDHGPRRGLVIGHHCVLDSRIKYSGSIDEVRVYNRTLSTDEIRALARFPSGATR